MNLISYTFVIFFALCIFLYYLVPGKLQNLFLLLASYLFYMWEPKTRWFGLVLFGVTAVAYGWAFIVSKSRAALKKLTLAAGVILIIGVLFAFKYYNSFSAIVVSAGITASLPLMSLALPAGISYFTLQSVGYLVDVYRGYAPQKNIIDFSLFVGFFPQLYSGPIGRAGELAPQFSERRRADAYNISSGAKRMLFGLFKKIVAADGLAVFVNKAYENPGEVPGPAMLICLVFYSLQLYLDFSGYVDIALGAAEMLGIKLRENFRTPYLSLSITEFWSRWHMSLTSWYRDYVYIPLGGNRKGAVRKLFNIAVIFILSGLWHGVGTTFIVWGAFHAALRCAEEIINKIRGKRRKTERGVISKAAGWLYTFTAVTFGWVIFRAPSFPVLSSVLSALGRKWNLPAARDWFYSLAMTGYSGATAFGKVMTILFIVSVSLCIVFDIISRHRESRAIAHPENPLVVNSRLLSIVVCVALIVVILLIGQFGSPSFIYYEFN